MHRHLGRLIVVLCSTALALGAAEMLLWLMRPRVFRVLPPGYSEWFLPKPGTMPGVSGRAHYLVNSIGMRSDEPPRGRAYRILTIGGSTTECLHLDQDKTWPQLLQKDLNAAGPPGLPVHVGNVGRSGHSTREHLVQLLRLLPQHPDFDAVVLLVGMNDLSKRLSADRDYRPFYWDEDHVTVNQYAGAFAIFPDELKPFRADLPFYKKTHLFRRVDREWRRLRHPVPKELVDDGVGEAYVAWRQFRREALHVLPTLPDLGEALAEYRRALDAFVDIAERRHVRVILATQPVMWREGLPRELEDLLWSGGVGAFQMGQGTLRAPPGPSAGFGAIWDVRKGPRHDYYSAGALAGGMDRYNRVLLDVCQQRHLECVDLAAALPRDTTVFYDDCHFNESGAAQVARLIAGPFLRQGPLARPPG